VSHDIRMQQLEALVLASAADSTEDGRGLTIQAPAVGVLAGTPRVGEIVVGGSRIGRMRTAGLVRPLVVPAGTSGRVARRLARNLREPVEYGQPILELVPVAESEVGVDVEGGAQATVDGLPEGCFAITSPTHGMFYRRPSPDAPSYVSVGDVVEAGATVALVEVMKCFSAISYGTAGQPPRAEVVEVRVEDGIEVEAEQVLFVLRPA